MCVVVRASESDFVNDHCSGMFEGVSENPSVGLSDSVFCSVCVPVTISDCVSVLLSFLIDSVSDSDPVIVSDCCLVSDWDNACV